MALSESLKRMPLPQPKQRQSLWTGPDGEGPNGGVTQSALVRFLTCRERFRLHVIEGLRSVDRFEHRREYGSMWHVCEEAFAACAPTDDDWSVPVSEALKCHAEELMRQYPYQQQDIEKWYNVANIQFPLYVEFWKRHPDAANRTPLLQEQTFDVPYQLPSGRIVRLRGKWDGVDLVKQCCCGCDGLGRIQRIANDGDGRMDYWEEDCEDCNGSGCRSEIWLVEHKTKGDIDEQQIRQQLSADLQTLFYLVALQKTGMERIDMLSGGNVPNGNYGIGVPIVGVRYNVIRRPLSGGKGTIVQHKATAGAKCPKCKGTGQSNGFSGPTACLKCRGAGKIGGKPAETTEEYHNRLAEYIRAEPETYFMRWNVTITQQDIERFKQRTLNPVLESLCDWWQWISADVAKADPFVIGGGRGVHFQMPYGCHSPLLDGGSTDLDEHLISGSEAGMRRAENLFPELQEG